MLFFWFDQLSQILPNFSGDELKSSAKDYIRSEDRKGSPLHLRSARVTSGRKRTATITGTSDRPRWRHHRRWDRLRRRRLEIFAPVRRDVDQVTILWRTRHFVRCFAECRGANLYKNFSFSLAGGAKLTESFFPSNTLGLPYILG